MSDLRDERNQKERNIRSGHWSLDRTRGLEEEDDPMKRYALIVALTVGLMTSAFVSVCSSASEKSLDHPQNKSGTNKPMTGAVKGQAEQETSQQRKKILDEATSAIQDTKKALKALEDKKSDEALKALERHRKAEYSARSRSTPGARADRCRSGDS